MIKLHFVMLDKESNELFHILSEFNGKKSFW